mgnify:CR=1 FL=1
MKKIVIFALIMAISVTTPIQTMAESVTQTGTEMQASEQNIEQNIEQIIDEITSEPHPINSDAIQNVKEYIIKYFDALGYDEIECQKFEYNDENNENAIRRSSQADVFLASTAENATVDGAGENIIVTKKSSTDTTKNLIISAHYDSAEDSVGANDNGSGVAAVLELARILKDTEMPYNVKFILFSGEEKYMLGSRWYVGNLTEDERKQIIGVINIDTIAEKSDLGYMAMIEGNKRPDDAEYDDEGLKKFPIKIAWALSIHKSQGQTFSQVNIDPQCWDSGQFYVAVSRAESIEGIHFMVPIMKQYIRTLSDEVIKILKESLYSII